MQSTALILGAGPAGLTAGYELRRYGIRSTILEADTVVGGISRTAEYKGFLFDIGGHRFFTKVSEVEEMWHEVLGPNLLRRPRQSRILYEGKFYDYPLRFSNVIENLGWVNSGLCVASYLKSRLFPESPENSFEAWVTNRFGKRLFNMFFKSYTEKVWGMSCKEIRAEWAAQRIKGLSLTSAVRNAIAPKRTGSKSTIIKTLIHEFSYPRRGPGMMWERTRDILTEFGCQIDMQSPVTKILWSEGKVDAVIAGGRTYQAKHFLSSLPIRNLIGMLDPEVPSLAGVAEQFNYRDFLTVALIVKKRVLFTDNWIYIHDPSVKVGRIQNFKNWSPEMVPDPDYSCIGLEYFCFEGDGLWTTSDQDLVKLATIEASHLGLVRAEDVIDGTVVRMPKAYPVYDTLYKDGIRAIREFLVRVPNLQLIGRNGMHHYNNQDHSMLTGMLAARNIIGEQHDVWSANLEEDYHEEVSSSKSAADQVRWTQPRVPSRFN